MDAICREDGELCGYVRPVGDAWQAVTVFGGPFATTDSRDDAVSTVLETGLAVLAERWILEEAGQEDQVVCVVEASPDGVTLALDYFSMPGVPLRRVERAEIDSGRVHLRPFP